MARTVTLTLNLEIPDNLSTDGRPAEINVSAIDAAMLWGYLDGVVFRPEEELGPRTGTALRVALDAEELATKEEQ